jgi:predicted ATPase
MEREPAIRRLTIRNLLSFGGEATTIELQNLNVLIGANGSGKSNLIEVIGLLKSTPKDLGRAIASGGPIDEWLWKGSPNTTGATIEATISQASGPAVLRYVLGFEKVGSRLEIYNEVIHTSGGLQQQENLYYNTPSLPPYINTKGEKHELRHKDINSRLSILAQRKDPENYPEITYLGDLFTSLRIYKGWEFGPNTKLREACDASLQGEYLEDDGSNLGAVLNQLLVKPVVKRQIIESLRTFYENFEDLRTPLESGRLQTRLEEKGLHATVPLIRMSDGTVRWLALLSILLNPEPQSLVVIEEPELGLHPDMIHELAKLLIDASTRMQLIITTHSTQLIEAFTDRPEAVIICEKENGVSTLRRLDAHKLSSWLEEYSLGQLWTKGQIGGTRW